MLLLACRFLHEFDNGRFNSIKTFFELMNDKIAIRAIIRDVFQGNSLREKDGKV